MKIVLRGEKTEHLDQLSGMNYVLRYREMKTNYSVLNSLGQRIDKS